MYQKSFKGVEPYEHIMSHKAFYVEYFTVALIQNIYLNSVKDQYYSVRIIDKTTISLHDLYYNNFHK